MNQPIHVKVDPNDPTIQLVAQRVFENLVEQMGLFQATGVCLVMLSDAFQDVLHMDSPMPELNIKMLHELLDRMRTDVTEHEKCALGAHDRLLALANDEPIPCEPTKPVVH